MIVDFCSSVDDSLSLWSVIVDFCSSVDDSLSLSLWSVIVDFCSTADDSLFFMNKLFFIVFIRKSMLIYSTNLVSIFIKCILTSNININR